MKKKSRATKIPPDVKREIGERIAQKLHAPLAQVEGNPMGKLATILVALERRRDESLAPDIEEAWRHIGDLYSASIALRARLLGVAGCADHWADETFRIHLQAVEAAVLATDRVDRARITMDMMPLFVSGATADAGGRANASIGGRARASQKRTESAQWQRAFSEWHAKHPGWSAHRIAKHFAEQWNLPFRTLYPHALAARRRTNPR